MNGLPRHRAEPRTPANAPRGGGGPPVTVGRGPHAPKRAHVCERSESRDLDPARPNRRPRMASSNIRKGYVPHSGPAPRRP
ncbi:protein of unknown function [Streptomyces murinus]